LSTSPKRYPRKSADFRTCLTIIPHFLPFVNIFFDSFSFFFLFSDASFLTVIRLKGFFVLFAKHKELADIIIRKHHHNRRHHLCPDPLGQLKGNAE